jgi:hypothetical protein
MTENIAKCWRNFVSTLLLPSQRHREHIIRRGSQLYLCISWSQWLTVEIYIEILRDSVQCVHCILCGEGLDILWGRLHLHDFYLWRHVVSTAPPFILWWWKFEILFDPLHRSSSIGGQRWQTNSNGTQSAHKGKGGGSGLDTILMSMWRRALFGSFRNVTRAVLPLISHD